MWRSTAVGSFEQSLKIIFLIKFILTAVLLTADHFQQYSSPLLTADHCQQSTAHCWPLPAVQQSTAHCWPLPAVQQCTAHCSLLATASSGAVQQYSSTLLTAPLLTANFTNPKIKHCHTDSQHASIGVIRITIPVASQLFNQVTKVDLNLKREIKKWNFSCIKHLHENVHIS